MNFKDEADRMLSRVEIADQNKMHIGISDGFPKQKKPKFLRVALYGILLLGLMTSIMQVPSVKAFVMPPIKSVFVWIEQTTSLPLFIPESWIVNEEADENEVHYFYELQTSDDSYSINIYLVEHQVPFNDTQAQLEKNGPLSESQRVGSISVKKMDSLTPPIEATIPNDAEPFRLTDDVIAHQKNNLTSVWWEQGNWSFEFVGGSSYADGRLRDLSKEWNDLNLPSSGVVKIIGGNRTRIQLTWEENEYRFTLDVGDDLEAISAIMEDYHKWVEEIK